MKIFTNPKPRLHNIESIDDIHNRHEVLCVNKHAKITIFDILDSLFWQYCAIPKTKAPLYEVKNHDTLNNIANFIDI